VHVIFYLAGVAVFIVIACYFETKATSRLQHLALYELFVGCARTFLDNHRQQQIAYIAILLHVAPGLIAQMTLEHNLQQRMMVGRCAQMVLHHDITG